MVKAEWHRRSCSALNYAEWHPETDGSVFNLFMAPSPIKQSEPPPPSSDEICKWSSDTTQKITSPQFSDQHVRKEDTFSCPWLALCFCSSCPCLDQLVPLVKRGDSHVRFSTNTLIVSIPSISQHPLDACIYSNDSFICKNFVIFMLSGLPVSAACLLALSSSYQPRKL